MDPVRFAHTSDWHLGAAYAFAPARIGDELRRLQFKSVFSLVDRLSMGEDRVDLLLVTGDVFSDPCPSMELMENLRSLFAALASRGIEVLILHGPNDPQDPLWAEGTGARVFDKPGELETRGLKIVCLPPVPSRKEENLLRRLSSADPFHVLMHFGHCLDLGSAQDPYHPFRQDDLSGLPCQYAALGSFHGMSLLREEGLPLAAFCGSPMAVDFQSSDRGPRHAIWGEISEAGTRVRPIAIEAPEFMEIELDCTGKAPEAMLKRISKAAEGCRVLRVVLRGVPSVRTLILEDTLRRSLKGLLWLEVCTEFEGVNIPNEEDEILVRFVEKVSKRAAEEGDPAIRQCALEMGIRALSGGME